MATAKQNQANSKAKNTQSAGKQQSNTSATSSRQGQTGNSGQQQQRGQQQGSAQQEEIPPLEKFFIDQLKDIYYAEQLLVKTLPKMEAAATTEELSESFSDHLHQTQKHVKRLEKVFASLGKKPEGKKCEAMEGLVKEAEQVISETEEGSMTRDAALIIAAQKVEHYEIATYGGLVQLALTMGLNEAADLLDITLLEEEDTDYMLTQIAENSINMEAEQEKTGYSWMQQQAGKEKQGKEQEQAAGVEEEEEEE